jgi:hypothetical protein
MMKEVPMASVIRVGAGTLVERFEPDVLEEIRIMAEASQAPYSHDLAPPRPRQSPFARLLGAVLATEARAA